MWLIRFEDGRDTHISDLGPADEDGDDDGQIAQDCEQNDDAEHAHLHEVGIGRERGRRSGGGRGRRG